MKTPSYLAIPFFSLALLTFHFDAHGAAMKNPDVKLNPNPRVRYELTATVENAPGTFERISGSIDYRVSNSRCVPLTPVTGATIVPTKHLPLTFEHVAGNEYKAEIFVDLLEDEDYFGLGVCHWELVGAGMDLVAGSVDFSPSIYREDILANKKVTRYFARAAFAEKAPDERVDIGESSPSAFKDANATFSVTIRAEEHIQ